MRHTDFYSLHKKLDEQAREELIAAIRAHGGEYTFIHFDEDGEYDDQERNEAPIIMAGTHSMDNYEDFYISRVELQDDKYLNVYGFPKEGWADEMELDCFAHGHLEYIIDEIPETDSVKSVTTMPPAPILILSPEDVECVGYNPNMTVSQFNELKRLMEKSFEWNMDIYWDALRQACENLGIEPLNKSDEDEED